MATNKIEIKKDMLSSYQLRIADLRNIPIGNIKKLVLIFLIKKYMLHYEKLQLYLRLGLKLKKVHRVLEFNQSQLLRPYVDFNTQKRIDAEKNRDKKCKSIVQVHEQFCVWKDYGKRKK